jgi:hypothetical protein
MHRRRRWSGLLAAAAVLLAAAPAPPPPISRYLDSPMARKAVNLLVGGDAKGLAKLLAYPDEYSAADRDHDTTVMMRSIEALLRAFGKPRSVKVTQTSLRYYEIGITGGPRAYWWEPEGSRASTRQYLYEVDYAIHGTGYIKIVTWMKDGKERVVGLGMGLPADRPPSRVRMRNAYQAVLDSQGAPPNHPMRKVEVQVNEVPELK